MRRIVLVSLALVTLAACGGTTPPPSSTPRRSIPLDTWLAVRETQGRGLPVGSGVRLNPNGMDVVSGSLGSSMQGDCVLVDGELLCSGMGPELRAADQEDGTFLLTQGSVAVTMTIASTDEAAAFDATLGRATAQASTCRAAAECCIAAEESSGSPCDLDAELGDRSEASCARARDAARARFADGQGPEACR